jgi:tRNA guanosine-2'-O-methyltransferase
VKLLQAKSLLFQDVREDLRQAIANDTVTIKNEDLAVGEHHKSDESVSEMVKTGQEVLDFQKKITPHRGDSEQALNLNTRGHSGVGDEYISRIISGIHPCKFVCVYIVVAF